MCIENLDLTQNWMSYYDARSSLSNKPIAVQNILRCTVQRIWVDCRSKDRVFGQDHEPCTEGTTEMKGSVQQ